MSATSCSERGQFIFVDMKPRSIALRPASEVLQGRDGPQHVAHACFRAAQVQGKVRAAVLRS